MANEKRLIDADALIDEIAGIYQRHYINSAYQFIHDFFRAVFRRIHKAHTVDAVEVVRCRGCKYWQHMEEGMGNCTNGRFHLNGSPDPTMEADDFCSCGEKL